MNGHVVAQAVKIIGFVAFFMSPVIIHVTLLSGSWPILTDILATMQIVTAAWLVTTRLGHSYRLPILAAAALMLMLMQLSRLPVRDAALFASGLSHSAAYGLLLAAFGASLAHDREPLVTAIARRTRSSMPPQIVRYTRHVTSAWCIFFSAQLAGSLLLLILAPIETWSFFVNVLNFPLVLLMFVTEFVCRSRLVSNQSHGKITDIFGSLAYARVTASNPAVGTGQPIQPHK
jgi:uncharacterized membrane protein